MLLFVYVLIITPVALISRLVGRDPLRMKKERWGDKSASVWEPRAPNSPASYLRQY
ncbi:MAG: hypothetical protein JNM17_38425 [Archangium sp.]|nr:hypothetical protein [Archangium sp.]